MEINALEKETGAVHLVTLGLDATNRDLTKRLKELCVHRRILAGEAGGELKLSVEVEHNGAAMDVSNGAGMIAASGISEGDQIVFAVRYDNAAVLTNLASGDTKYSDVPEWAKYDPEVCKIAVLIDPANIAVIPKLQNSKEFALLAVSYPSSGLNLKSCGDDQGDLDVVFAAVRSHGGALQYATEELRQNEHICLAAVRRTSEAMKYCDAELRQSKSFVLRCAKTAGACIEHIAPALKDDHEIVQHAVRWTPDALQYSPLRGDADFVKEKILPIKLCALKHCPQNIKDALRDHVIAEYGEGYAKKYAQ